MTSLSGDTFARAFDFDGLASAETLSVEEIAHKKRCYLEQHLTLIEMVIGQIQDEDGFITQNYAAAVEAIRLRLPGLFSEENFILTSTVQEGLKNLLQLLREKRSEFIRERSRLPTL